MSKAITDGVFITNFSIIPMRITSDDNIVQEIEMGDSFAESDLVFDSTFNENLILPQNCRAFSKTNGGYSFLLEFPPFKRTIKCSYGLLEHDINNFILNFQGTNDEVKSILGDAPLTSGKRFFPISLQFPWTLFIVNVNIMHLNNNKSYCEIGTIKPYFSKCSFSNYNDILFIPPLSNIYEDGHMCIPRPEGRPLDKLSELVGEQTSIFWDSVFNTDLQSARVAYRVNGSKLSNLFKWSIESSKDPLFIYKEEFYNREKIVLSNDTKKSLRDSVLKRLNGVNKPNEKRLQYKSYADGRNFYRGDIVEFNNESYIIKEFMKDDLVKIEEIQTGSILDININDIYEYYKSKSIELVKSSFDLETHGICIGAIFKLQIGNALNTYLINKIYYNNVLNAFILEVNNGLKIVLSDYIIKNMKILSINLNIGDTVFVKYLNLNIFIGSVTKITQQAFILDDERVLYFNDSFEQIGSYKDITSLGLESPIKPDVPFRISEDDRDRILYIPTDRRYYIKSNDMVYTVVDFREKVENAIVIKDVFTYKFLHNNVEATLSVGDNIIAPNSGKRKFICGEILEIFTKLNSESVFIRVRGNNDIVYSTQLISCDYGKYLMNTGISKVITSFKINSKTSISVGDKIRITKSTKYIKKSEVIEIEAILLNKRKPSEIFLSNGRCITIDTLLKYFVIYRKDSNEFLMKKNQTKFKEYPVLPHDIGIVSYSLNRFKICKVTPKNIYMEDFGSRYLDGVMVLPTPMNIETEVTN